MVVLVLVVAAILLAFGFVAHVFFIAGGVLLVLWALGWVVRPGARRWYWL